jgi:hypothetical protein
MPLVMNQETISAVFLRRRSILLKNLTNIFNTASKPDADIFRLVIGEAPA